MDGLHERLAAAAGSRTYRAIGDITGIHPETVRRYMQGQAPSIDFITTLADALDINAHWLLTGRGPMSVNDLRAHALRQADPAELLSAVAAALEGLTDRVDRIESYVQTLETRVRAATPRRSEGTPTEPTPQPPSPKRKDKGADHGKPGRKPGRVADAITKRSRPHPD